VVSFTPRLGHFTPREKASGTYWIGGWVGPGAGLDMVAKRKFPALARTQTPNHPTQPIPLNNRSTGQ